MPPFFLNKRLIVLLVSIILLVALLGFSLKERENIPWPEQFVKDIVGFGQSIVSKPASYVAGFFEDTVELQNTYNENQKLKSRLEEFATLETKVKDLEQDNEELRLALDIQDDLRAYEAIHSTVVARNPDQWEAMITIDKGSVHGVKDDMAIRTAQGLIGKVKDANKFSSTVELLTSSNPRNRVSAIVQGDENDYGWIIGYDEEKQKLILTIVPYDKEIKEGQQVITSGLGGVFPKGLPIGKVTEVAVDKLGLTKTAYIEPNADFYDLEHVYVIQRQIGVTDEENEE
ncbi:rod shape-determining protein MreC [Bacillus sp. 2205SS5-2]|uniref:rod shape-determining protein MreC n=1 Tax=Bacillus sp. 2205SS5-2 TaxID=3109031 RepID=UPI003005FD30